MFLKHHVYSQLYFTYLFFSFFLSLFVSITYRMKNVCHPKLVGMKTSITVYGQATMCHIPAELWLSFSQQSPIKFLSRRLTITSLILDVVLTGLMLYRSCSSNHKTFCESKKSFTVQENTILLQFPPPPTSGPYSGLLPLSVLLLLEARGCGLDSPFGLKYVINIYSWYFGKLWTLLPTVYWKHQQKASPMGIEHCFTLRL